MEVGCLISDIIQSRKHFQIFLSPFGTQWKRGSYINLLVNTFSNTHAEILWRYSAFVSDFFQQPVEVQGSQL